MDMSWIILSALCGICITVHKKCVQKTCVHFNIYLYTMSKTQIKLDVRVLNFCLGLCSIEIFKLDVQLNKNQSIFINRLCLMWAKVLGEKKWT